MKKAAEFADYSIEEITPDEATQLIISSEGNRTLRETHIRNLMSEMKAGRWRPQGGSPIKIDYNGVLRDGHHRLTAVVDYGKPVLMHILRGVQPDAQKSEVIGSAWKCSDVLHVGGVKNANVIAAAGAVVLTLEEYFAGTAGGLLRNKSLACSPVALAERFAGDELMAELATRTNPYKSLRLALSSSELAGFLYFAHSTPSAGVAQKAVTFIEKMTHGAGLQQGEAIHTLRAKFMDRRFSGSAMRHSRFVALSRGWNGFVAGRPMAKIPTGQTEFIAQVVKV